MRGYGPESPMDTARELRKLAQWYERSARFMQMPQDREMQLRYADHFRRLAESAGDADLQPA